MKHEHETKTIRHVHIVKHFTSRWWNGDGRYQLLHRVKSNTTIVFDQSRRKKMIILVKHGFVKKNPAQVLGANATWRK